MPMERGAGCCFMNSRRAKSRRCFSTVLGDSNSICRILMLHNTDLNFKIVKKIYNDLVSKVGIEPLEFLFDTLQVYLENLFVTLISVPLL